MPTIRPTRRLTAAALAGLLFVAGCTRKGGCTGDYCGTLVIATGGEPDVLLPVVSDRAITRDVTDQLFLKLADLGREVPRSPWRSAAFGRAPVGDGPYRFVAWRAGESLELSADSTFFLGRPHLRRLIWRFTPDQQVAVTQLIAGDADAVEVLITPDNVQRACADAKLSCYPYKGSAYGYVGFNLAAPGDSTKPHPLFGDRELRRALFMTVDRERLLR